MTDESTIVEILAHLTERDEAGRHFTETCSVLPELEELGWITIDRPVHEATGIPYSQEYWHITITDAGLAEVE